ncbi:hypothetical protein [Klebsiella michiganensis]|nr:hypothetical protein [Klebsiella michiganensis]
MRTTGILTAEITLHPYMKPLLILSVLLRWSWLTDKCFKIEVVSGNEAEL